MLPRRCAAASSNRSASFADDADCAGRSSRRLHRRTSPTTRTSRRATTDPGRPTRSPRPDPGVRDLVARRWSAGTRSPAPSATLGPAPHRRVRHAEHGPRRSGGLHSVYQEASGLRALGVDARSSPTDVPGARPGSRTRTPTRCSWSSSPTTSSSPPPRSPGPRSRRLQVRPLGRRRVGPPPGLPPRLRRAGLRAVLHRERERWRAESLEARASYDSIPGMLLFAETHWICNAVGRVQRLPVAKIEPGIDEQLFTATHGCLRPSGPYARARHGPAPDLAPPALRHPDAARPAEGRARRRSR